MNRPTFDLQAHSTHSDGSLPAADVVARAAQAGVELFALTDHDTVDGVAEALAAAAHHGLRLLPAVEISAVDAGCEDLHILGYGIDHADPVLLERLHAACADRVSRIEGMLERLVEQGWVVDDRGLRARRDAGKAIGRPHLAQAVVANPDNAARLERGGCGDPTSFLVAHLVRGKSAYVNRSSPPVADAIGWIHDAGGLAVWAHPFWDITAPDEVSAALRRYRDAGIDGVEAFYIAHDARQTALLVEQARELDLVTTGSSDFHGPEHSAFSRMRSFSLHGHEPQLGPLLG